MKRGREDHLRCITKDRSLVENEGYFREEQIPYLNIGKNYIWTEVVYG